MKGSEPNHSMGSPMDGTPPWSKDLIEIIRSKTICGVTVRRPLKWQKEERKVVPPGVEPRASGLRHQRSATVTHPPTATPPSPFITLFLVISDEMNVDCFIRMWDMSYVNYMASALCKN